MQLICNTLNKMKINVLSEAHDKNNPIKFSLDLTNITKTKLHMHYSN